MKGLQDAPDALETSLRLGPPAIVCVSFLEGECLGGESADAAENRNEVNEGMNHQFEDQRMVRGSKLGG